VGDVCGHDHKFGLAIVFGNLDFGLALREFATVRIAILPNLVEEVVIAEALKDRLGFGGGLNATAFVRKGHALLGLVGVVDADCGAAGGQGFNGIVTSRVGVVADDKVEGDRGFYVCLLGVRSRSKQVPALVRQVQKPRE
jgi:hypothetical protein